MKGLTLKMFIGVGSRVLGATLKVVTPHLRRALEDFLADKYKEAVETPNPWDDHFYAVLMEVLDVEKPEVKE